MKILYSMIVVLLIASPIMAKESASERRDRQEYEQRVRQDKSKILSDCDYATRIRTSITWKADPAAKAACFNERWNQYLYEEQVLSEIRRNEAETNRLNSGKRYKYK